MDGAYFDYFAALDRKLPDLTFIDKLSLFKLKQ